MPIEPYQAVNDVILPIFRGEEWKELDDKIRFDYLNFVRAHWETYQKVIFLEDQNKEDVVENVAQTLLFQCRSDPNEYVPAPQLLLPEAYNPGDKLESVFVGIPGFYTVSLFYLEAEKQEIYGGIFSGPSWHDFLCELGALERSAAERIVEVLVNNLDWVTKQPYSWLGNLFSFLYDLREDTKSPRKLLQQLQDLPFIPSDTGEFLAAIPAHPTQKVFLPLTDGVESYKLFQGRFNLVAQELLELRDNQGKIRAFLKWLGIRQLEAISVIEHIILPIFEGDDWRQLDEDTHFAYLNFVRKNWRSYREKFNESEQADEAIIRVSNALQFRCRSDDKYYAAPNLLLSQVYGPNHDLESILFK